MAVNTKNNGRGCITLATGSIDKIAKEWNASVERTIEAMLDTLDQIGEEVQTEAIKKGSYENDTHNLRSSIGYEITRDGEVWGYAGGKLSEEGKGEDGVKALDAVLDQLRPKGKGLCLTVAAGVHYAAYVEDIHNRDVLTSSKLKAKELAKELIPKCR